MSFAYVVGLAAHGRFGIALLDWGGGIGHYRVLARALFPGIEIDYWCRETPVLADAGSGLHPGAHFSCDDACLEQTYDLVMAGTSLHYVESWQQLFKRLCQATAGYLYIANTPVTTGTSYVFVQRPYAYGYDTEYVGWCLSRDELLSEAAAAGMHLTREFVCGYGPAIARAPGPCEYRGFLFSPRTRGEPGGTP